MPYKHDLALSVSLLDTLTDPHICPLSGLSIFEPFLVPWAMSFLPSSQSYFLPRKDGHKH